MNTRKRSLFAITCFILMITGCSNDLTIKSASSDKVVIVGNPANFTEAYEMAQKECQKHTKSAIYITDETADLDVVAFECVGEEVETEVAESETQAEEAPIETEAEVQTTEEGPVETELEVDE
jgi:predicted metallo-beta-lactamase superfamily hydrolase